MSSLLPKGQQIKQNIYPNPISINQFFEYLININTQTNDSIALTHINYYLSICKEELIFTNRQLELLEIIMNNKCISNKKLIFDILEKNDIKYDFYNYFVNILNSNDPNFDIIIILCFLNKSESKLKHHKLFKIIDQNDLINQDNKNKIKSLLIDNDIKFDIVDEFIKYIQKNLTDPNMLSFEDHLINLNWFMSEINNPKKSLNFMIGMPEFTTKTPFNCNLILSTINKVIVNKDFKSELIKYLEMNGIKLNIYNEMVLSILNRDYSKYTMITWGIVEEYYKLLVVNKADCTLVSDNNETIYHLIAAGVNLEPKLLSLVELLFSFNIDINIKNHDNKTAYDILLNSNYPNYQMMTLLRQYQTKNINMEIEDGFSKLCKLDKCKKNNNLEQNDTFYTIAVFSIIPLAWIVGSYLFFSRERATIIKF
jgi:hypothetical protein